MMRSGLRALSSEAFDSRQTSSRLLAGLADPVRLFVSIAVTFSIVGGVLQIVGSARGPSTRPVQSALAIHIGGNLIASGCAIVLVLAAQRALGSQRAIGLGAATIGGAIGGVARLPLEVLAGTQIGLGVAVASMLTDAAWFMMAALVTNVAVRLARDEHDTRHALNKSLRQQAAMRTQMLAADLQTRRDIAEWLHGHLQSELLLAVDVVRHAGPDGDALASRLTRLREVELRDLAHSLHPVLAEVNLVGALQDLIGRYRNSTHVTLNADEATIREPLAPEVAIAAYRSCEEAIANAVGHGSAQNITVTLTQDRLPGHLTVVTEDDGSSGTGDFELGLGLTLIDTYTRTVGGTWDLTFGPTPGVTSGMTSGATLTVSLPLVGASTLD